VRDAWRQSERPLGCMRERLFGRRFCHSPRTPRRSRPSFHRRYTLCVLDPVVCQIEAARSCMCREAHKLTIGSGLSQRLAAGSPWGGGVMEKAN
jgi:hypothetical protein